MDDEIRRSLVDGHLHLSRTASMSRLQNVEELREILRRAGLRALCVQNIVLWEPRNRLRNPLSLLLKLREPTRVFSFGGLTLPAPDQPDKRADYAGEAARLLALGFDGIKLFGKPNIRRAFGEPFDSAVFDGLYAYLQRTQTPILFHMGDPRAFWSRETAPPFAVQSGWVYDGPDDVPCETLYDEIERLLTRFPRLRVVFAHFYFLADDLPRLRAFLRRWPAVRIDITPGAEMYPAFSRDPAAAREFFLEFQYRIHFGTDNVGAAEGDTFDAAAEAAARVDALWRFLSSDSAEGWGERLHGLSLPADALQNIACNNFYRFVGRAEPRPVSAARARAYAWEQRDAAAQAHDPALDAEFERTLGAFARLETGRA